MKNILSKTNFPLAPGGNTYHWKTADTVFQTPEKGKYLIKITASAKSAVQKRSRDDDDLRVAIDGYEFGKYEIHEEQISWKGFGTSSSWDGASLKGATKTIHFFLELAKGKHQIKFFADGKPVIKEIQIFQLENNEKFKIKEISPDKNIKVDKKGIPWMSFVFLGVKPKTFSIGARVKSGIQKKSMDGDNLKVVINGKILQNKKAPTSDKYKNFYFSGDLNRGKVDNLIISPEHFEFLEDSVELWYDENPTASIDIEIFDSVKEWLDASVPKKGKNLFYQLILNSVISYFNLRKYEYSSQFLRHSLSEKPEKLYFDNKSSLAAAVKKDPTYKKIVSIVQAQIERGIIEGHIPLGDKKQKMDVEFITDDLRYSLHGLKEIEYKATEKNDSYLVEMELFDVYDFDAKDYQINLIWPILYVADALEKAQLLKNFEIEINISELITS